MADRKLKTYPQMLHGERGEGWEVINSGVEGQIGVSDLEGRVLVVPDGDSVEARNTRVRELAHARWTPHQSLAKIAARHGVNFAALLCAEEYRTTFNLKRGAPDMFQLQWSKGAISPERIMELSEQIDITNPEALRQIPMMLGALGDTEGARVFQNTLTERANSTPKTVEGAIQAAHWKQILNLAGKVTTKCPAVMSKALRRTFAGFPRSLELAKLLMDFQDQAEQIGKNCREEVRNSKGQKPQQIEMQRLRDRSEEAYEKHQIRKQPILSKFGRLKVTIPPMVMPVKAKNKIARHRVTEEGILPFQLYRLVVDGKIFLDPRKQRGGSVVVDISGSMGLSPDQVYEFVLACPGATIAQYSGSGETGELVVVAHKGRIAPRHLIGKSQGGNVVDGPALEWVARQPKPRVWVSDTQVTGVHDCGVDGLRKICLDWCQKHQIKVVTKFDVSAVTRALYASHRRLLAAARKVDPYGTE